MQDLVEVALLVVLAVKLEHEQLELPIAILETVTLVLALLQEQLYDQVLVVAFVTLTH